MTMFTRNDKMSETSPDTKIPETRMPERSAPVSEAVTVRTTASAPAAAPKAPVVGNAASVISKSLKITGQLESSEAIRIDGTVEGDVRGQSVTVGNGATVNGTVTGETVELSGTVNGKIEARSVVLMETARMSGDVIHQDIRIESGAFIDGNCRPAYGKGQDTNVRALNSTAAASQDNDANKPAGSSSPKAGFGTL